MKDLTGDNHLTAQCADWLEAKKQLLKWQKIEKDRKSTIINALNKSQVDEIKCGQFEITRTHVEEKQGKAITLDQVGEIVGARKAYSKIQVNEVAQ